MASRSTTGCFACKTKHKKCDETKPQCLRCQKSRTECPGYTYIQDPNKPSRKPRTLPAPRTVVGQSRAATLQGTPLATTPESSVPLQGQLPLGNDLVTSQPAYNTLGNSVVVGLETAPGAINISNQRTYSSSSSKPLEHPAISLNTLDPLEANLADHHTFQPRAFTSAVIPMTSGQASLLAALFSLGQFPDQAPRPHGHPATGPSPSDVEPGYDVTTLEDVDHEGVVGTIYRQPVLDRTIESNALPFVLQSYATWISQLAFEPKKLTRVAQDFVFSYFEDGQLQSRWIIALLANVGSRIGNAEFVKEKRNPMLSALQDALRQRLGIVKSRPHPERPELVKMLNTAIEASAIIMYLYTRPINEGMALRLEVVPIVRQLCSEPPNVPISLSTLLRHPVGSLRRFAQMDITYSVAMDTSTLLQYDVSTSGSPDTSVAVTQDDGIVQWLHGIPNRIILAFGRMLLMRANGLTLDEEAIASVERDIRELQPYSESSAERYITIMRSVVQESWRQVALVYLYMAVCGDPSGVPRVKEAFRCFMRLLDGTQPGRLPDEFLTLPLIIISPAAQRKSDREAIRQRIVGLRRHGPTFRSNNNVLLSIEGCWARADAEGRQGLWSDVAWSRRQGLST